MGSCVYIVYTFVYIDNDVLGDCNYNSSAHVSWLVYIIYDCDCCDVRG